jgi:hypothetical protein
VLQLQISVCLISARSLISFCAVASYRAACLCTPDLLIAMNLDESTDCDELATNINCWLAKVFAILSVDDIDGVHFSKCRNGMNKDVMTTKFVEALEYLAKQNYYTTQARSLKEENETLKSKLIVSQEKAIGLQGELLASRTDQLETLQATVMTSVESAVKKEVATVQTAVKSEFTSWSKVAALNRSHPPTVSPDKLKEAIRSVVVEEDRSRNFVIFNKEERVAEDVAQIVSSVLEDITEKPRIIECRRIGKPQQHGKSRPIKVKLTSSDAVAHILRKAKDLKSSEENKATFIGPDRSVEERKENRTLVEQLKEKIKSEPGLYHFIRRGHIFSIEKNATASTNDT